MNDSSNNIFLSDGKNAATSGKLTHGSLFSGIGGFDLAAEWMGWENVFHCEWNEFGQRILKYYWPKAISYEDITKTDFSIHRGKIDILTGGFPCQPYSSAGKRLGKEDDRHLWPEMLRAIREIQPKYIVGENVYGLTNWNGGLVFNEVQVDLENEGYKVQPCILPACAVNAPHRRDRVWFVAYSDKCTAGPPRTSGETESDWGKNNDEQSSRRKQTEQRTGCSNVLRSDTDANHNRTSRTARKNERTSGEKRLQERNEVQQLKKPNTLRPENPELSTNTEHKRQQEQGQPERPLHTKENREWKASWAYDDGRWPTQSPICSGDDGLSNQLDGITFPKWRQESIKAYGNAIVPQVAYQIFKALMITESKAREEKNIITGDMDEPIQKTGT
ncbi:DNA (cytosine-5-)-methyltransferase [Flavobacterium sediminilitoris]|uniref:Cytosine-specific methyltransferase n=1 Tax=Flavobacterium sediminilitoris TaxID=2024526 RepID=A0ABY4HJ64_9FLAO|nr:MULTISPECIES: DNA (cytosine-5-)-methyltransferase [Flavobacterium]UOX32401.1 DNA (cytosine-5-)-methyltransferase [Flavobacterium sediminilitoris]